MYLFLLVLRNPSGLVRRLASLQIVFSPPREYLSNTKLLNHFFFFLYQFLIIILQLHAHLTLAFTGLAWQTRPFVLRVIPVSASRVSFFYSKIYIFSSNLTLLFFISMPTYRRSHFTRSILEIHPLWKTLLVFLR